jgi:ribulose-5-phosphate 4-epimerase/fuculose-1-phosphate aldolase
MAYTPKIVSAEKSIRNSVSQAEWNTRVDLAAAYRYVARRGWNEGIYNHLTVRVPEEPQHLLIKPHALVFEEVTASNLIKLDMQGNQVDGGEVAINPAAATIHTAVLIPRQEINAVVHLHSRAGVAISVLKMGLRCLNQEGMTFYNRIGYHDFEGVATDRDECARIAQNLGTHKALILRNHGLLTCGGNIGEAVIRMKMLIQLAEIQLDLLSSGAELIEPPAELCEKTAQQLDRQTEGSQFRPEWAAILRELDRVDSSYRD